MRNFSSSLRPMAAVLLLAAAGCATAAPSGSTSEPAPVLDPSQLAGCTYERIGTVTEEDRSGLMRPTEADIRRAIGRRASLMGADAVTEFKMMTVAPVSSSGSAGARAAAQTRATGVAIRFTSPACPGER